MAKAVARKTPAQETSADYARDLALAFGGALMFAFPLLMTMEMWALGFAMDRGRLVVFIVLVSAMLVLLNRYTGFRRTACLRDDVMDALSALLVGFLTAAVMLTLFAVMGPGQAPDEVVGRLALLAAPAAIGAVVARKQFAGGGSGDDGGNGDDGGETDAPTSYLSELFLMAVGALFVVMNVAPTEEMPLIAYMMAPWQALLLALGSIALLHAVVYSLGFAGQHRHEKPPLAFLHFTVPGYAIALLVSLYVQWTFGHLDGQGLGHLVMTTAVLSFPGALGAGAARLLV